MATHLETVQWRVRPTGLIDGPSKQPTLPVDSEDISPEEVELVVKMLKINRSPGPDNIPAEYWKAVVGSVAGLKWLTTLCNLCWRNMEVPTAWHVAHVTAIYKKGPVELCGN
jgi:hypothetical protein